MMKRCLVVRAGSPMEEAMVSKAIQCGFDSHVAHTVQVGETMDDDDNKPNNWPASIAQIFGYLFLFGVLVLICYGDKIFE